MSGHDNYSETSGVFIILARNVLLGGSLVMLGLGLLDAMVKMGSSSQGFELRLTLGRNRD
jgi:hypothetical protein